MRRTDVLLGEATEAASPSGPRTAESVPDRVGRYVVVEPIGRGGMGVVFAAYDPELDRKVAIKLIDPRRDDLAARVRLLREAQAMAKLQHPNVVAVHDVGTFGERVFVAMEFVRGRTLTAHLEHERRSWREVLALFIAAGRGLAAAHGVGLVHRDFKPDNVLVSDDGRVRVGDFGLARAAFEDTEDHDSNRSALSATASLRVTQTGALLGTPAYMAPEQHARLSADARTDQFSFCVALYEALWGERPFGGKTPAEITTAVLGGEMRPIPRASRVPLSIGRAIARGLASDPRDRWPDMAALLTALERAPRRARAAWTLAGASVLAGSVAAAGPWLSADPPRCGDPTALLDGVWDDARRAALAEGFTDTHVAFAKDTWERLEPLLDGRARAWAAARIELCEAHERHDLSDARFDRTIGCLSQRRQELVALLDVLAAPDATTVSNAVTAASNLPAIETCEERADTDEHAPLPPDAALAERVAEVREQLDAARVVADTGRLAEARATAESAVATAEALEYRPLVAEARHRLAWILDRVGEYDAAEQLLRNAWFDALSASHDVIAARAASDMLLSLGVRRTRFDEATSWARNAEAFVARLSDDTALAASYHANLGNYYGKRGDNARAVIELRTALDLQAARLGVDHPAVARQALALGLTLQRAGEYEGARAELHRALEIQERALGPDHPEVATTLNNLGLLYASSGRYDDALAAHERALAIRRVALEDEHPDTASSHTNLGMALRHLGRWDEAAEHLDTAIAIKAKALGDDDPQVADALTNLGNLHFARDDYAAAADLYRRALEIYAHAFGAEHPDVGAAYNNLGIVQWKLGDLDGARTTLERALALWERVLGPKHPDLAATLLGLGEIAIVQDRAQDAVVALERAVALLERATPDSDLLVDVRFALARALVDDEPARARELAEQAATSAANDREKLDRIEAFLAGMQNSR